MTTGPTSQIALAIFPRLLGVVYLLAFVSLSWLQNLVMRLLEGSPPVVALFRTVPFSDAPPAYIRLKIFRYHFTDRAARRAGGGWWRRSGIGESEPMTLKKGGR